MFFCSDLFSLFQLEYVYLYNRQCIPSKSVHSTVIVLLCTNSLQYTQCIDSIPLSRVILNLDIQDPIMNSDDLFMCTCTQTGCSGEAYWW